MARPQISRDEVLLRIIHMAAHNDRDDILESSIADAEYEGVVTSGVAGWLRKQVREQIEAHGDSQAARIAWAERTGAVSGSSIIWLRKQFNVSK